MNPMTLRRAARIYAMLVGSMDALTGVGLVIAPAVTLALMGVSAPDVGAQEHVRFVGVFVAAVGASYLWLAAVRAAPAFRAGLVITTFFRLGAGGFALGAVVRGVFDRGWLLVAATDLACAVVQAWLLAKGGKWND